MNYNHTSVPLWTQMMEGIGNPLATQVRDVESEVLTFTDDGGVSIIGPTAEKWSIKKMHWTILTI